MKRMTLSQFSEKHGQTVAAAFLGMKQGSLSKALRLGRHVFVTCHDDGTYSAEEVRAFPSQNQIKQSA